MRPIPTHAAVHIDPTTLVDHPLSKERIAVYNSGLVPIERYERDATHIAGTAPESLRIDLGWGAEWMPWTREVVTLQADGTPVFDFTETDRIARLLEGAGTRPYWSYCYVPRAARDDGDDWRTLGRDDDVWVQTVRAYIVGMRERDVRVGYHEVYNEPDLRDERTGEATFFTGELDDYLDLYRVTARAIREADPTARVGGPALALTVVNAHWLEAFCRMVVEERLPLDFLSFHHYGHFGLEATLRTVREVLTGFPTLRDVELHLNEYNAFSIDYPRGGLQDGHHLATAFAAEIPRLLSQRDLTRTHWAQFLDSGNGNYSGMVDIDGVPKPIHAVYHFYQQMPIDRVRVDVDGPPGLGALASTSAQGTAAIIWNRHFTDLAVDLTAGDGDTRFTMIDQGGVAPERSLPTRGGSARIEVPTGAVVLLRIGDPLTAPARRRAWGIPVAVPTGTLAWSDLDEAGGVFRFGPDPDHWTIHGADFLTEAPVRWLVTAQDASGAPVAATVVVRADDDTGTAGQVLTGNPGDGWDAIDQDIPGLPDRPRPAGSRRFWVAAKGPAGSFVRVEPVAR